MVTPHRDLMIKSTPQSVFEARAAELANWLADEAPYAQFDQQHLDAGTQARAYWHLGYRAALVDALDLIRREAEGSGGTSSHFPVADPDA